MESVELLKRLQKQLKLTTQQLADTLGISKSVIDKYRTGQIPVPVSVVLALRFLVLDKAIREVS